MCELNLVTGWICEKLANFTELMDLMIYPFGGLAFWWIFSIMAYCKPFGNHFAACIHDHWTFNNGGGVKGFWCLISVGSRDLMLWYSGELNRVTNTAPVTLRAWECRLSHDNNYVCILASVLSLILLFKIRFLKWLLSHQKLFLFIKYFN